MYILLENIYPQMIQVNFPVANTIQVITAKLQYFLGANFYPLLGCYSSRNPIAVAQHMKWIRQSGIGVLVISWYPPDSSKFVSKFYTSQTKIKISKNRFQCSKYFLQVTKKESHLTNFSQCSWKLPKFMNSKFLFTVSLMKVSLNNCII